MRRGDVGWGVLVGVGLAGMGFLFYRWGLSYPLLNLYAQMTFWLGVPAVFNLVHRVLGYGELAKDLAFVGAVGVWLALHPFLLWAFRRWGWAALVLGFALYALLGGWLAGLIYTALLGLAGWGRGRLVRPVPEDRALQVRAVEVGEKVQEATRREPLPDGATGYHTVRVRVG
ncbi:MULTISPECIES: hypothetical protein [unclassified Meiothermus]|uniref:hypothetical protein n=1 Tax=unclassified Meiothermus TaxID=370471 RepID=UPI00157F8650|nr:MULTISPECIES: hypothetical protein [unclassified Meiothermus]